MRLRTQITISFAPIFAFLLLIYGLIVYAVAHTAVTRDINQRLDAFANLQVHRLRLSIEQQQLLLSAIASRTQLRIQLREYLRDGEADRLQQIGHILADAQDSAEYIVSLRIAAPDGRYLVGTNDDRSGGKLQHEEFIGQQPASDLRTWVDTSRAGLLVRDLQGELHSFLIAELALGKQHLGFVVMESTPTFIEHITHDYVGLGETGESNLAILRNDGGLEFLSAPRFPDALHRNTQTAELPLYAAASGQEKLIDRAVDYRGKLVVAATRYLSDYNIGLEVKLDRDEAYAALDPILTIVISLAAASIIFVYLIGRLLASSLSQPLEALSTKARRMAEERGMDVDTPQHLRGSEIDVLAHTINGLLDEAFQSQQQLAHEKLRRHQRQAEPAQGEQG